MRIFYTKTHHDSTQGRKGEKRGIKRSKQKEKQAYLLQRKPNKLRGRGKQATKGVEI